MRPPAKGKPAPVRAFFFSSLLAFIRLALLFVGSKRSRPRSSPPSSSPPPPRSRSRSPFLRPKIHHLAPLPAGVPASPSFSAALALRTEALRCQYELMSDLFHFDRYDSAQAIARQWVLDMSSWYTELCSRYTDVAGELVADQFAREKRAAGKRRAFVLSSDEEDGEDELDVAQELDQESGGDAAMVE
jgi:hypothetical protein